MLGHGQSTDISQLIHFNRTGFSLPEPASLIVSPSQYVAQIDYSLLENPYDINRILESLSHHYGIQYQLTFTNVFGEDNFTKAALFLASTGTARLRLPLHAFVDDNLVTYFCLGLSASLTELMVDDAIPLDHTTLSYVRRNLVRLILNFRRDIRHVTFPITLSSLTLHLPRLSHLALTGPESHPMDIQSIEHDALFSLLPCSSNISTLSLPAVVFTPKVRNAIATRFLLLQELQIVAEATSQFTDLPLHKPGDFRHLRHLSFNGTLPQFIALLPTLLPPFISQNQDRKHNRSIDSYASSKSSSPPKFVSLTLQIPFLTNKYDMKHTFTAIERYVSGVDIVGIHVQDWGPGEPKNGSWWTASPVPHDSNGQQKLPGRLMCSFTHPCRKDIGSKWNAGFMTGERKVCRPCLKLREWLDGI
jgi:hypothetical protein